MNIPHNLTYETHSDERTQRIDITGERQDVRGYLETLLDLILPHAGPTTLRQAYSAALDEREKDFDKGKAPSRNDYLLVCGMDMMVYYEPGIAGIHPWASKPSAHFPRIKEHCDRAWEKTIASYANGDHEA